MKAWALAVAIGLLGGAGALLRSLDHAEVVPNRETFASFPTQFPEGWHGQDVAMDQKVLDVLRLSDYLMRVYASGPSRPEQPVQPVWFYIGYYASQRTGTTYHSPKNCLPGAGWQLVSSDEIEVELPGLGKQKLNQVLIEKGLDRQVVLYWYQDRGRVIASEYSAKAYLIWDAWARRRTDGSMVRVSTPATDGVPAASERALRFVRESWPFVVRHLPS